MCSSVRRSFALSSCIIATIRKHACALGQVLEQMGGKWGIMGFACREFELQWQAMSIDAQVQLGGQSAS